MGALRSIDEHVAEVLARVAATPVVQVPLAELATARPGLVVAEPVVAAAPVPAFDHAAVDGYAFRRPSFGHPARSRRTQDAAEPEAELLTLTVTRPVRAGDDAGPALRPGEAVRIMTGAPLPAGADTVVPVEATSTGRFAAGSDGDETTVTLTLPRKDNVRRRGEDLAAGDVLAQPGEQVTAALLAAAAASGVVEVAVHRRPRVAVVSTGSELHHAGAAAPGGGIVDSNSLMLAAIVTALGAEAVRRGGVPDDAASLRAVLDEVAADVDLVVTTGGVSAGDRDVVREVLLGGGAATGVDLTGVAMRPGRPQALASWRDTPWIGLPGTPPAAFTAAHLFVRAAVGRLGGRPGGLARRSLPLAPGSCDVAQDDRGCGAEPRHPARSRRTQEGHRRTRVLPVTVRDGVATPTALGGHALGALLGADGLALVPPAADGTAPVDVVDLFPGAAR